MGLTSKHIQVKRPQNLFYNFFSEYEIFSKYMYYKVLELEEQGPVVQNFVSLTLSLRPQLIK